MLKALARSCFLRDDWKCRHCGNRAGLHPHHVHYKSAGGEDMLGNLITLCAKCHRDVHDGYLRLEVLGPIENGWSADIAVRFWKQKGWKP